ncbi:hypothetical protein BASA81_010008 [Batrachochytrium salamandrivorans]|nr:hypothetical protein BASA81_010008 [Batrachochytrium salamandrivorans]
MAALTLKAGAAEKFDFTALAKHLTKNLPSYAVPLFLRVMPQMEATATMKQTKGTLRTEGIDIGVVSEPLYYLQDGTYVRLTKELYAKVCTPGARL